MTDPREQSQTEEGFGWHDATHAVSADALGPFQLVAENDNYERDGGYFEGDTVRLRLYDSNTDTFLIDREATPIFPGGFSVLDLTSWKQEAEEAIVKAGYDLQEVLAQARQDNAA